MKLLLAVALASLSVLPTSAQPGPTSFEDFYKATESAWCGHDLPSALKSLPALRLAARGLPENDRRRVKALLLEDRVRGSTGDAAGAIAALDEAEAVYRKRGDGDRRQLADLLIERAGRQSHANDETGALKTGREALPLLRALHNDEGEGAMLAQMGLSAGALGDHRLARNYFQRALAIFKRLKKPEGVASVEINLAEDDSTAGRNVEAEKLYLDAIAVRMKSRGEHDALLSDFIDRYSIFLSSLGPERAAEAAKWKKLAAGAAPENVNVEKAASYGCSSR